MTTHALYILAGMFFSSAFFLVGMDNKNEFFGTLSIDPRDMSTVIKKPVAYIPPKYRKNYPYTDTFQNAPLQEPFMHIKIESNSRGSLSNIEKITILTIIPAQKLQNCTDGSQVDIVSHNRRFHLTCAKNETLFIDTRYLPGNENMKDSFRKQFLGSMNQFFSRPTYCTLFPPHELISQEVLEPSEHSNDLVILYKHGPRGCSSFQQLNDLATNIKTKNDQYSRFKYVTRREYGIKPQLKQNQSIDFNLILINCLREIEYENKAREKILNECFDELLIVPSLLARACINQLIMRSLTQLISQKK